MFTKERDDGILPPPPTLNFESKLGDIYIPADKVEKLLRGLHTGKACGPDGLHPLLMLSRASAVLANPITMLFTFRQSLEEKE